MWENTKRLANAILSPDYACAEIASQPSKSRETKKFFSCRRTTD
jgi:hypothetical protein